jgi:predicted alpha-1,2-mannosidase
MKRYFIIISSLAFFSLSAFSQQELVRKVDPFIGTEKKGNTFPGASLPFGMVKLGPDCGNLSANAGYSREPAKGFSHTHVSGTEGGPKYGNILFMPFTGQYVTNQVFSPLNNEVASPGFFAATLMRYNVNARFTVTSKAALHEYTYPADQQAMLLIDVASFLSGGLNVGEAQELVGCEIRVLSSNKIEGYSRVRGGWNCGDDYTVYFSAEFNQPIIQTQLFKNQVEKKGSLAEYDSGEPIQACLSFGKLEKPLLVKVGISHISTGKAQANAQREIADWNFDALKQKAEQTWEKALGNVVVEGGSKNDQMMFYTALYHSMLMPVDRTDENPKWKSNEPYYDDFYSIWNTYRTVNPLLTLIAPDRQRDILRSLLDIYRVEGYLPDSRSGNANGRTQGGSNADILFADAMAKDVKGINYAMALQAMIKDAEVAPGGDERKEGRGGLADYNSIGYVSTNYERAGTRTMEYAYCDYAISTVAKALNKNEIAAKYLQRSQNWQNLWNDTVTSYNFKGFIWPKDAKGVWSNDFSVYKSGLWKDFFYKSQSWEYSLFVPHNVAALIEKCGGNDRFLARLDTFFTVQKSFGYQQHGLFIMNNEPGFLTPCLYNYINRPDRTAAITRSLMRQYFRNSRSGLPGNDDAGATSAWMAFHAMGFYPNAGQDIYLISSPIFEKVTIHLENGKDFVIEANNAGSGNVYVQKASLNGKSLENSWFTHADIMNGGRLKFDMGSNPSKWGLNGTPPPSAK